MDLSILLIFSTDIVLFESESQFETKLFVTSTANSLSVLDINHSPFYSTKRLPQITAHKYYTKEL